ncbi:eukaryotic translation initiation factor 4E transporter-like isoform X2 [Agrilus planipennis]|uniref:Eukaryotic translation initiation factor 4E transporter-like isoform X2 n=1 Tax=Agrilus planipennis TaxID=224129 RepID=A0A1W4XCB5_AGRPL|nr:eukaryotic translation initiation factor 4E transporter-like isoform X2 [Agrilus planipennis]
MARTKTSRRNSLPQRVDGNFNIRNRQKSKKRVKRVSWRDEEIEGMSLVSLETTEFTAEFTDPAILAAKPAVVRIRYTKEELVKLRQAPQSLKRPECFDPAYDIWQFDRKSSDTPSDNSGRFEPEYKRRSNDPRERVRKEQDGIVLSPQRRSFNSGCFVPVKVELQKRHRSDSPLGNKSEGTGGGSGGGSHHMQSHREIPAGARRIGSGRILTREVPWDYQDKGDADAEYGYRRERRDTDRDDRFERRSYGRDNIDKDKEKQHGRSRYGGDRRRISNEHREEEPEWFSGGPSSQNDTIELRGFDDDTKKLRNKKQSPSTMKRSKERALKNKERQQQDQPSDMKEKRGGGRGDDSGESDGNSGAKSGAPNASSTPNAEQTNGSGETDSSTVANHLPTSSSPITTKADDATKKYESKNVGNVNGPALDALEAILESKSIPSILTNGIGGDGDGPSSGSRFSRFFKTSSPPKTPFDDEDDIGGSHSSASMHDNYLLKTILRDISETKVTIPGETESSFAPISPAAYTGGCGSRSSAAATAAAQHGGAGTTASATTTVNNQKPLNLIDILQRNRQSVQQEEAVVGGGVKNLGVPGGKVLSLEELEAKMLQQGGGDPGAARIASAAHKQQQQQQQQKLHNQQQQAQQQPPLNKVEEDMTAFKRLLAQVSGGHAVPATNGPIPNKPPMSILEMLSHSQQQEELSRIPPQMGPLSPNPLQAPHIPNDLILKLQQVQNHVQQQQQRFDMLNKLMNAGMHHGQQLRTNHMQEMSLNQSRELLGRPEAQAILQGLKRGDITPQHLYQQLANPAMQPRHRELLLTIIKLHGGAGGAATAAAGTVVGGATPGSGIGPSPRVLSPVPPPHALFAAQQQQQQAQQSQQLRVSPLPPNAMHQRIPSPRELQVHTQNIMQRALIKKKLEEQQENFKKRQEMQQRGQSPAGGVSPAKQTASPTPLAFTPTSVLRKMTAERDEGGNKDGGNKNADSQNKTQQGRPVVGMKNSLSQMTQQQQPQQQNQSQWNVQQQQQQSLKQPGRAIVKANSNFPTSSQQQQSSQDVQQFFQQQRILNQQQRHKMSAASGPQSQQATGGVPPSIVSSHHHSQQQQQQQPLPPQQQQQHNYNHNPHHYHQMNTSHHHHGANNSSIYMSNPQSAGQFQTSQNNHLTHQQLRAQHQQQQQPSNQQQTQQHHYNNNRAPQQPTWGSQQQQGMFGQFQNYDSRSAQMGRGGVNGGGGDLSPTSNQLARWFSPDLLERARAGKLPNMPNASHSQHAINLEELERQTAPPVHN